MKDALGLYIHIPFCVRKCSYCDFLSAPADEAIRESYTDALVREIRAGAECLAKADAPDENAGPDKTVRKCCGDAKPEKPPVDTIFIGGGTPSVMTAAQIRKILDAVQETFSVLPNAEVTMEMNPGAAWNEDDLREICTGAKTSKKKPEGSEESERTKDSESQAHEDCLRINRVSLGLQSVHDTELAALGRIHTFRQFEETFRTLRACGVSNLNTDLMFGIPGQTPDSWRETLETVSGMGPEHISAYSLIVEEGTPFFERYEKGLLPLPDEEAEREMAEDTVRILGKAGYRRYEISNYAKDGFESRHNIRYWKRRDYLGFGTGAASCVRNIRWSNERDLNRYINSQSGKDRLKVYDRQVLTRNEQMEEFLFLGLRMTEGVRVSDFEEQFGTSLQAEYGPILEKYRQYGLLDTENGRLFLTAAGLDVSNVIFSDFLHD